ncbi:MAG: DUF1932 domain-containing protein [Magnetovibrio sp.]|nr:DUF1932 domain-containing protein [Magnetovibrio sp.]
MGGANTPKLAFIGFGEAGPAMAAGLIEEGVADVTAYDILQDDPAGGAAVEARAADTGARLAASHADAVAGRDIVISTVTCADAVEAAGQAAPSLRAGQIYMDVNSVSPETKRAVAEVIAATGADFVEASIMSPIRPLRHASPILLSGPAAPKLIERLRPFGMDLEDMGPEFGRAAATKMFRSIVFKGFEALFQECVIAADGYGVAEKVLDSICKNYPEMDWHALASYYVGRSVIHGERRAHEMREVAATLAAIGVEPMMAEATSKRLAWLSDQDLKDYFEGREPETYREVLDALRAAKAAE